MSQGRCPQVCCIRLAKITPDLDNKVYPPPTPAPDFIKRGKGFHYFITRGGHYFITRGPGPWILNPGPWIRDPGSRIRDPGPGSRIRDPGSGIQDPGSRILDPGSRVQNPGCRIPAQLLYYPGGHYFITRGENPITLLPGGVYYPLLGLYV